MAISYPLINGVRFDASSFEIKVNGTTILGVKELSYGDGLEPGEVRGTSPQRLGRTRGKYDAEGSITLFKDESVAFEQSLQGISGLIGGAIGGVIGVAVSLSGLGGSSGLYESVFDIVVNISESDRPTVTDTIVGCRVKKADKNMPGSPEAAEVKYDLDVMYILHNGASPISNLRQ